MPVPAGWVLERALQEGLELGRLEQPAQVLARGKDCSGPVEQEQGLVSSALAGPERERERELVLEQAQEQVSSGPGPLVEVGAPYRASPRRGQPWS